MSLLLSPEVSKQGGSSIVINAVPTSLNEGGASFVVVAVAAMPTSLKEGKGICRLCHHPNHPHLSPLNRSIPAIVVIRMVVTWQISPTHMREATPDKHPLGRPPSAYKMVAVDMHCTWMRVLWGQHQGQWSVGWKAAIVRVICMVLMWPCNPHPSVRGGAGVVVVAATRAWGGRQPSSLVMSFAWC